ncbi:MAG TPA: hypothetical protein ENI27_03760, partial [bacterium]|nr:hypothetical protein [bacterium]
GIEQDNSNEGYLGSLNRFHIESDYVEDVFGNAGSGVFIAVEADNIYTFETLDYVNRIHERMEMIPGVTEVSSIISLEDVSGRGDEIRSFEMIEKDVNGEPLLPRTDRDLARLRSRLESNDIFESVIYSKKKNNRGLPLAWNIAISIEESDERSTELVNKIEAELDQLEADHFTTYLFGGDVLSREVDNSGVNDLITQVPLIILVICLIYFLNFGTVSGVVFPITGNIISVLWTYSIIGYVGMRLAFIHLLLLPLLIALGSSYAIHLLNQYYREGENYTPENKRRQIGSTLKHILMTITLAGLTTAIGLLSNVFNKLVHLRTFGIFAALGVLFSVIVAITYIPAMLAMMKIPSRKRRRKFNGGIFDRIVERINRFTVNRPRPIFVAGLIVVGVSVAGSFLVSNEISNTDYFVKDHKIRFLTDYFSDNFDGVETMSVVIDTHPNYAGSARYEIERRITEFRGGDKGLSGSTVEVGAAEEGTADFAESEDPFGKDVFAAVRTDLSTIKLKEFVDNSNRGHALRVDTLGKVEDLMHYAESLDGVGKAFSFVDLQQRFNYTMHNDDPAYKILPDTDQLIIDYTNSFGGDDDNFDGLPDIFESFIDPTLNVLKITLKLKNVGDHDLTTGDSKRIRQALSRYLSEHFDTSEIYYLISGGSIAFMTIQSYIVTGQILSIVFSLIVIAFMTSIIFRSLQIGLLSVIPLGIAVLVNFGVMGFFGIKLDIATALIASFAIGIGIDDTIHFLLNFRKEMAKPGNADLYNPDVRKRVVYQALRYTSKAIIFTSLALIFGFTVVGFSSFLPIKYFSILVALTMVNATIATLMFLPAVIVLFPLRRVRGWETTPAANEKK